jgi:hypothetical protein
VGQSGHLPSVSGLADPISLSESPVYMVPDSETRSGAFDLKANGWWSCA